MSYGSRNRKADLSAVILFPNKREVACASLGLLKTYEVFRNRVAVTDISYLPSDSGDSILSARQGLLLGEMSHLEIGRFDIIGFSVSYENDFPRVPGLLIQAGVAPLARDREATFPLVVSGGFTMSTNPLPVADFVDAVVIGEIEPVADALVERIARAKLGGEAGDILLDGLASLPGIYVPARGEKPVERIWSRTETMAPTPGYHEMSHFGEMMLVETGRGCGRGCHFCAAGNLYRPVRMRRGRDILALARGAPRVGLVGTAVGDHPDLKIVLEELIGAGQSVGMASLRPDQVTPEIAGLLVRGGVRTIAIAPEAGTEELRARIGKPLGDAEIVDAVRMLSAAQVARIKLYFMVGLPGETDDDVEAVVGLVRRLAEVRGKARLVAAAGPFVPKPHTVFQWAPFCDKVTLRRRFNILREIRRMRGCSLRTHSIDGAWVEAILSRGDRSLSGPLLEAARGKGPLKRILRRDPALDPSVELDIENPLPWDFIDAGIDRKRLRKKYLESKPS